MSTLQDDPFYDDDFNDGIDDPDYEYDEYIEIEDHSGSPVLVPLEMFNLIMDFIERELKCSEDRITH
jgi:hypothetical protein